MKSGIHPTFYPDAVVICACGNTWTTGSTKKEIHTDVCSKCHPFFTGEQRIVDTAGQVERFMKRISAKEQISAQQPAPEEKRAKKEKRRERRAASAAPAPAPLQPPAELPLAVVAEAPQPQAQIERPPAPEVTEARAEQPAPVAQAPEAREQKVAPQTEVAPQVEAPKARVEQPAPTAEVEERPVQVAPARVEDMRVEQVAPAVTIEEVRPEENVIVPPAMQIGEAASVDKVVEVTEGGERQVAAPRAEETPAAPVEAAHGIEETVEGGKGKVRERVSGAEKPKPVAKTVRKPRAPRRETKAGEKPKSTTRKSAPSKTKKGKS